MKKALLTALLPLLFCTVYSQKSKWEYGVQSGININTAYGGSVSKQYLGNTTGLSAGIHAKLNTSGHFGIKAGLSYDQFGWVYRGLVFEAGVFTNTRTDVFYQLNYFNLPVLAEYSFGKKVRLNVNAGVFTGVLVSSKLIEKTQPPVPAGQAAVIENKTHEGKRFNFGLSSGIGVQVPLTSKMSFGVEARNYTGITNGYRSASSIKTLTFSGLGGFSFKI